MGKQIGHEEQPGRLCPEFRLLTPEGKELEQRIDGHDLAAGGGVKFIRGQGLQRLLHHAGGAVVPVMDGVFQQIAVPVQQAEIHTPGVEGDTVHRPRFFNAGMDVFHQVRKVPAEMSVRRSGVVIEAVDLPAVQPAVPVFPQDGPAAGTAEVKGQNSFHGVFILSVSAGRYRTFCSRDGGRSRGRSCAGR